MCHKSKYHQEHPKIGKRYGGKLKIYLNDAKLKYIIADRELKP